MCDPLFRWLRVCVGFFCALIPGVILAQAPVITSSPFSKLAAIGEAVSFEVVASGTGLSYQWSRLGQPIAGAVTSTLTLGNVTRADHGWYRVVVTNSAGSADAVFALTVAHHKAGVVAWGGTPGSYLSRVPPGLGSVAQVEGGWLNYALKTDGSVVSWDDEIAQNVISNGVVQISARHLLALKADGSVAAHGDNFYGQATVPAGLAKIAAVAAGYRHSLALKSDGTVAGWGSNAGQQLDIPVGLKGVVAIAAGGEYSVALKVDGTVVAWGDNSYGQCTPPAGLADVIAIAAGATHTIALRRNGTVVAWGGNSEGQATIPAGLAGVDRIAAGEAHSVALKSDGTVAAWGRNDRGQVTGANGATGMLGIAAGPKITLGLMENVAPAIVVPPATQSVTPGSAWQLSVVATGTRPLKYVWKKDGVEVTPTWGGRISANLATLIVRDSQAADAGSYTVEVSNAAGSVTSAAAVMTVASAPEITQRPLSRILTLGQPATFAVSVAGAGPFSYQWRRNGLPIAGATSASFLIASATLADRGNYEVVVSNSIGGISRAVFHVDVTPVAFTRVAVTGWAPLNTGLLSIPQPLRDVVELAASSNFTVAVRADGTVAQWGMNYYGQSQVPADLANVVGIAANSDTAVALTADGTLRWWTSGWMFPDGTRDIVAVVAQTEWYGFLALRSNGTVISSGPMESYVEAAVLSDIVSLGRGFALRRNGTVAKILPWFPDPPAGLQGVVALASGEQHHLALKQDGTVVGWGTGLAAAVPAGLTGVIKIVAGESHSLAIKADGTVVMWGSNTDSQLNVPAGTTSVIAAAAGRWHNIILTPSSAPVITQQPRSSEATGGQNIVISVTATGTAPLLYQWYKNGIAIPAATSAQLYLGNLIEADSGGYSVGIENSAGSVTSAVATLVVREPDIAPVVRRSPVSIAVMADATATVSLVAGGGAPRSIQWYAGYPGDVSQPIPGATGSTVVLPPSGSSERVWARITNGLGAFDSPPAVVMRWESVDAGIGEYDLLTASYANGRYFVGSSYFFGASEDAQTWAKHASGGTYDGRVAYANGVYVRPGVSAIQTSVDGVNWTPQPASPTGGSRLVHNGQLFVAVAGQRSIHTSPDGVTWTRRLETSTDYLMDVCSGGGITVVAGKSGTVYRSSDGVSWTQHSVSSPLRHALFANRGFMLIGDDSSVWTAGDGLGWTKQSTLAKIPAAPAGGAGVYVGVTYPGEIAVSPDGIQWTSSSGMVPWFGSFHSTYGNGRFLLTTERGRLLRSLPLMGAVTVQNQPAVPAVLSGQGITLTAVATGPRLTFQWYQGTAGDVSQPIAGATSASFTTPALATATQYWVRVSNEAETVNSRTFEVVIAQRASIVAQPQGADILAGTSTTITVSANGPPAPDVQWYRGYPSDVSRPIAGATRAGITVAPEELSSQYFARAATIAGASDSRPALITRWSVRHGQVLAKQATFFRGRHYVADGSRLLSSTDGRDWVTAYQAAWPGFVKSVAHDGTTLVAVGDNLSVTTTDGTSFTARNPPLDQAYECDLAYGNGVFVTAYAVPVWSTDAITWTRGATVGLSGNETWPQFRSICFANGQFVGVGADGSFPNSWIVYRSVDGRTWNQCPVTAPSPTTLNAVTFGGGLYVAVGYGGSLFTSADGQTWTSRSLPGASYMTQLKGVAYGNGAFVVGTDTAGYFRSTDGVSWTSHRGPAHFSADRVHFANGQFLGLGASGWVHGSSDGMTWSLLSGWPFVGAGTKPRGFAMGNGKWILIGGENLEDGGAAVFVSSDGSRWTSGVSPGLVTSGLVFAGGQFVCGGAGRIHRSIDLTSWESIALGPTDEYIRQVIHNGRQFVALTDKRQVFLSDDGRVWTAQGALTPAVGPLASSGSMHVLAWNSRMYASQDWRTWTEVSPGNLYEVQQLAYANGRFVAYNWSSSHFGSKDGVIWSRMENPSFASYNGVAVAGGRFLAFSDYGHAWSLDGTAWTASQFDSDTWDQLRRLGIPRDVAASDGDVTAIAGAPAIMVARRAPVEAGIVESPAGQIILSDERATLAVTTAGTGLQFQWYEGQSGDSSRPVGGATAASFTTPPLAASRDYWVSVSFGTTVQASATAHVEVLVPPTISAAPVAVIGAVGGSASFAVTATSPVALRYQWYHDGEAIPGATGSTFAIGSAQPVHAGVYSVSVSSAYGTSTSAGAALRGPNPAPEIQAQPQPATLTAGQPAALSVTATGVGNLAYQWRCDGVLLPGATTSTLAFTPVTRAHAGTYDVIVSDGLSATISLPAPLGVRPSAYPEVMLPDPAFAASIETPGGQVAGFLPLADGRLVAFGWFSRVNDVPARGVVRFDASGGVDAAYSRAEPNDAVLAAAWQADGRLVIGGNFTRIGGEPRPGLARLNVDGSLDASFLPDGDFAGTRALALQPDGRIVVGGEFAGRLARVSSTGTREVGFTPQPNGPVAALVVRADGGFVAGGAFTTIAGASREGIARFGPDGSLTTSFAGPGFNGEVTALRLASGDRIVAGGAFTVFNGVLVERLARFTAGDALDLAYSAGGGFDRKVTALDVLSDDRVLVAGEFFTYRGIQRRKVVRVSATGTLDGIFQLPSFSGDVTTVARLAGGTILIAGSFSEIYSGFNGGPRFGLAQVSANGGSVSSTFAPGLLSPGWPRRVRPLADGKLIVAGDFRAANGELRAHVARLQAGGTTDLSFNPAGSGPDSVVRDAILQPDGRLLLIGPSSTYNGAAAGLGIMRVSSNGALDPSFNASWSYWLEWGAPARGGRTYVFTPYTEGALRRLDVDGKVDPTFDPGGSSTLIATVIAQPDRRLVVAGAFRFFNGSRDRIVRLLPNGMVDASFRADADGAIQAVALQPDGRIIIAGEFARVNGVDRIRVARLLPDGGLDGTFDPGAGPDAAVNSLRLQEDGRVLLAGAFTSVAGVPETAFATRLHSDGTVDPSFAIPGLLAPPAVLELLDDGSVLLGGRRAGSADTPFMRLRSYRRPTITAGAGGLNPTAGDTLSLAAASPGVPAIAYQWYRDGVAIPGATDATLTLPAISPAQGGRYTIAVSSPAGVIMSQPVNVSVRPVVSSLVAGSVLAPLGTGMSPTAILSVEGTALKRVLVRATGPSLAPLEVPNPAADPTISIVNGATGALVAANDNWGDNPNAADLARVTAELGASPLPAGGKDAALLVTLSRGTYRIGAGPAGATGTVGLEVYDADEAPRLVYLAVHAHVSGSGLAHAFRVAKVASGRTYLVRALGPALGTREALSAPALAIFAGQTELVRGGAVGPAEVVAAEQAGGAALLPGAGDATLLFSPPGAGVYTASVTGPAGAVGEVLLEMFELDDWREVGVPLALVVPPRDVEIAAGEPARFGTVALARPAASFQWHRNSLPIEGATRSIYVRERAQVADAGTYSVVIRSGADAVTAAASLVVQPANNATQTLVGRGYEPGGVVSLANVLHFVGSPSSLSWSVTLPVDWRFVDDTATGVATRPAAGATGTLTWTWTAPAASPLSFTYTIAVPADETATRSLAPVVTVVDAVAPVAPAAVQVGYGPPFHDADVNRDGQISLLELTRVIELYNVRNGTTRTGAYRTDATAEDGFATEPARAAGAVVALPIYHAADSDRDGRLSLAELTRVVQLYNTRRGSVRTGAYEVASGTEDGFRPSP